jgi:hypothetical protein
VIVTQDNKHGAGGHSATASLYKNLAYASLARAPEMPPNHHQQPTIVASSNLRT